MSGALVKTNIETGEITTVETFDRKQYLASLDTVGQQALARAYDEACAALIGPNDVQVESGRSFKKKSAWRKLARHFNISTAVASVQKEFVGDVFLATVTVTATGPWGQSSDAVGACATDEATGRRIITMADALATAETRATNRAVSNLIAMGEVSAEEIGDRQPMPAPRAATKSPATAGGAVPSCPKCHGAMWDNRVGKKNPKSPDFKCKDKGCDGLYWPGEWPPKAEKAAVTMADAVPERTQQDIEDEWDRLEGR